MIQINEIRYKNYFETVKYGSVVQISGFRTYSTDKPLVRFEGHGGEYSIEDIRPIEITALLLLKFGFDKFVPVIGSFMKNPSSTVKGYGFRFHTQYPFSRDNFLGATEIYYMEQSIYVKKGVKYVHQLQNLYFALTGEELVFSLD